MKTKTLVISALAIVVLLWSCFASPGADRSVKDRPYTEGMVLETVEPTETLANDLVDAYLDTVKPVKGKKEKDPTMVVSTLLNNSVVVRKSATDIFASMAENKVECAIVTRPADMGDKGTFWKGLMTGPSHYLIAYDVDRQPIYIVVDSLKSERWDNFITFCRSDAGQRIVEKQGFKAIPHTERP